MSLPLPQATAGLFGLYIHVPYCRYVCPYCDFNVVAARSPPWEGFTKALLAELAGHAAHFSGLTLRSIYFGGGTPSLAPPAFFTAVMQRAAACFSLHENPEITLEANPGTLDERGLQALRQVGINRLSLGWQSTQTRILKTLGRDHSAAQSLGIAHMARQAGFDNLSLDFIFAVPGQSMSDVHADLDAVADLAPEHVSLYGMTFHEGTPFYRRRAAGKLLQVDEDLELVMMQAIGERLGSMGYEHYEVSNFAKPQRRAVHNSLYWQSVPYLGVGPGAHSLWRQDWQRAWRWEGLRQPKAYVEYWSESLAAELAAPWADARGVQWCEELTCRQLLSERMLCGLRMADGVNLHEPLLAGHREFILRQAAVGVRQGWLRIGGEWCHETIQPTPKGLQQADSLAALFF